MSKINRALVTGGAGFIGSHTVDLLLQRGNEVVVLDNLSSGKLSNLAMNHPNLEFVEGDVLEFPLLEDLMGTCDAVLHLAAIVSVPFSIEEPIYSMQVNTQGFLHVLQVARKIGRPIRIVWASSAAVYGEAASLPCEEDKPLDMGFLSPYALQKFQAEQYADLFARLYQTSSLGLRYFNVYGGRQDPVSPYSGVISRFVTGYQQGTRAVIFGDGRQSRDFIAVEDVARANVLALQSDLSGIVNIATGQSETLLQLVTYIEQAGEVKPFGVEFELARPGDIRHSCGSIEKAKTLLGFEAQIKLEGGIKKMLSARRE